MVRLIALVTNNSDVFKIQGSRFKIQDSRSSGVRPAVGTARSAANLREPEAAGGVTGEVEAEELEAVGEEKEPTAVGGARCKHHSHQLCPRTHTQTHTHTRARQPAQSRTLTHPRACLHRTGVLTGDCRAPRFLVLKGDILVLERNPRPEAWKVEREGRRLPNGTFTRIAVSEATALDQSVCGI
eukprot:1179010-Prorocentrum_minimum.AAC.1